MSEEILSTTVSAIILVWTLLLTFGLAYFFYHRNGRFQQQNKNTTLDNIGDRDKSNEKLIKAIKEEFRTRVSPTQILPYLIFLNPDDEERITKKETRTDGCLEIVRCLYRTNNPCIWVDQIIKGLTELKLPDIADILISERDKIGIQTLATPSTPEKEEICSQVSKKVFVAGAPDIGDDNYKDKIEVCNNILDKLKLAKHECKGPTAEKIHPGKHAIETLETDINECNKYVFILFGDSLKDGEQIELLLLLCLNKCAERQSIDVVIVMDGSFCPNNLPDNHFLSSKFKFEKGNSRLIRITDEADYPQRVLDQVNADIDMKKDMPYGNIAHGQAWSHYTGFIRVIGPDLKDTIKANDIYKKNPHRMSTKFYEFIPKSGDCPPLITGGGPEGGITIGDTIEIKQKMMRGGSPRDFAVTVWRVDNDDDDEKPYYIVGEYPSVIKVISGADEADKKEKEYQIQRTNHVLKQIVNHKYTKCKGIVRILYYDDYKGFNLRKKLVTQIKHDIQDDEQVEINLEETTLLDKGFREKTSMDHQVFDVSFIVYEVDKKLAVIIKSKLEEKKYRCASMSNIPDKDRTDTRFVLLFLSKKSLKDEKFNLLRYSLQSASSWEKGVNIVPVLVDIEIADVPLSLNWLDCARHVQGTKDAIEHTFNQILEILKGPDYEIKSALPAGNVYIGLAWGYCHNYLNFVIPAFKGKISYWHDNEDHARYKYVSKRFHIIIPKSCIAEKSFEGCKEERNLMVSRRTEAGASGRPYHVQVYSFSDGGKTYYFGGHYATPVVTLQEMMREKIAGMSRDQMEKQVLKFMDKVKTTLDKDKDLEGTYSLILYDDREYLTEAILKELKKEFPDDRTEEERDCN